jgi:3-hydroxyisobutyrate dehydrogenase-like beta-hydroxyacid dehydrogenase
VETIGFVGLGEMGAAMAASAARAGRRVVGFDVDPARMRAGVAVGVEPAGSSAEAARAADRSVVSMVRTLPQTEDVLFGPGGIVSAEREFLDVVVMSTVDPTSMRRIAERGAREGLTIIDAPVSGGVRGAEAATLAIMAAGDRAALERVRPLLSCFGSNVFEVGAQPGDGQAVKLANQVMMGAAMAGTFEGLALASAYGVDPERVLEAVAAGTGSSWVLLQWDWMRSLWERYEPGNALDILYKDMRALMDEASARRIPLPVAAVAFQRLLDEWGRGGVGEA